jgi:hypothetical protein
VAQLFAAVTQFFEEDGWPYEQLEEAPVLVMECEGENGHWHCLAEVREEAAQFLFYSLCPYDIPDEALLPIEQFINRANFGLIIGNFEIDTDEGDMRYKTSIDVSGSQLDMALIHHLVYANVISMDRYLPGIRAVIEDGLSAEEAIALVED